MKRDLTTIFLYTIIIFTFHLSLSCEQDNNEIIEQIEPCKDLELEYILLNDSFKSIPYNKFDKELHFIDSLNNEVVFEFFQKERLFITGGGIIDCPTDNSKRINVTAKCDHYSFYLASNSDEVDIEIYIALSAQLGLAQDYAFVYDRLDIVAFPKNQASSSLSSLDIQVNQRENNYFSENNNFYNPVDSINLNGKVFYNVYYEPWPVKDYLYYNYEFGLIAFKNSSGKLWVLKTN